MVLLFGIRPRTSAIPKADPDVDRRPWLHGGTLIEWESMRSTWYVSEHATSITLSHECSQPYATAI